MLDPRIYRAALVPCVLVTGVVAFSLQDRPRPIVTTLSPQAFTGTRTFREVQRLAARFPDRRPGSAADAELAERIAAALRRDGFPTVRLRRFEAQTIDGRRTLATVVAHRPGRLQRGIVILAHRDAAGRGAAAELSGTAALLELGRVFQGRVTNRPLTLVSTSGGSGGAAGAKDFLEHHREPVDAALVLGDLAGTRTRRPFVVPWSNSLGAAPLRLSRTVEAAVGTEFGTRPGGQHAVAQFMRFAAPLTVGEQGPFAERGVPAVMLQGSGELGPEADDPVSRERLQALGRATLRSVSALDNGPDVGSAPRSSMTVRGKVVPGWAVRLLVGTLLLPPLLVMIDGVARARRRREPLAMWVRWALAAAVPFALTSAFVILLARVGILPGAPGAPPPPSSIPMDGAARTAVLSAACVFALGWLVVRPAILGRLRVRGTPRSAGAGTTALAGLCVLAVLLWALNPYAAALLVLPVHLWLLAATSDVRMRRGLGVAVAVVGLLPVVAVVVFYAVVLSVSPLDLAWLGLLLVAGGHIAPLAALGLSVAAGCTALTLYALTAGRTGGPAGSPVTVRGPLTYAGPGSLGGTDSALRR